MASKGHLARQDTIGEDMDIANSLRSEGVRTGALEIENLEVVGSNGASHKLRLYAASETDIGGMRENQDDVFMWRHAASNSLVLIVIDGHGRECGQVAAVAAREFCEGWLEESFERLLEDDYLPALREMFAGAHMAVKDTFRSVLQQRGDDVEEAAGGYLVRRYAANRSKVCVYGGAAFSVVAITPEKIISANVGDSSVILGATQGDLRGVPQFRTADLASGVEDGGAQAADLITPENSRTMVITADHSPESPKEFVRMRNTHPSAESASRPAMMIVYDTQGPDKSQCPEVFRVVDGKPEVTNNGRYWKNTRQEWAALVAAPPYAQYRDALAFTRSLGDLHLQTWGLSHMPEVHEIPIGELIRAANGDSGSAGFVMIAASDGIWDNWGFGECMDFVLDTIGFNGGLSKRGITDSCNRFMVANKRRGIAHFGSSADNATAALVFMEIISA